MNTSINRVVLNPKWQVSLTVQRPEQGAYVGGIWVRGESPTEFTIRGAVVPLTRLALPESFPYERILERMEGMRAESSKVIYGVDRLRIVDDEQSPGDRIIGYQNGTWLVLASERWDDYGFFVTIIAKLPAGINE
jgi:hypothetical protein